MAGELRIHRGGGFTDRARAYKILVDGELAGEIRANETRTLSLAEGEHEVQLKIDWCTSKTLQVGISSNQPADLSCCSRNPFLAFYWVTFGRHEYIDLAPDQDPR
jgi:hypothetical protein